MLLYDSICFYTDSFAHNETKHNRSGVTLGEKTVQTYLFFFPLWQGSTGGVAHRPWVAFAVPNAVASPSGWMSTHIAGVHEDL